MISLDLARRLKGANVPWTPAAGDRFIVPDSDMDGDVFVVSDMVVELREVPSGHILAFNGTTEWALDSIDAALVLWLPREDQLRDLLGSAFVALERLGGDDEELPDALVVVVEVDGSLQRHVDVDAESAYARAVLALADR